MTGQPRVTANTSIQTFRAGPRWATEPTAANGHDSNGGGQETGLYSTVTAFDNLPTSVRDSPTKARLSD